MNTSASPKFQITPNGDDARTVATSDNYEEAQRIAKEMSVGDWLGTKVIGPSGKITTYFDGVRTGYLDGNLGWVREDAR